MSPTFGRYFVGAFVLSVAYILVAGYWYAAQRERVVDPVVLRALPASWVVPSATNPSDAKRRHLFWVSRKGDISGEGVAVDVLGHPELFRKVFPGYPPEMARDTALWDRYFQNAFDPTTHYAFFGAYEPLGLMLHHSWTGCFDIVERYGADVVIMGSSETYRGVMPDLLAEVLDASGKPEWRGKRILACAVSRMLLPTQQATVTRLEEVLQQRRIDAIVWGVSFWTLFQRSGKFAATAAAQNRELGKYVDKHEPGKPLSSLAHASSLPLAEISLATWLGRPTWEHIVPFPPFSFAHRPLGAALFRLDPRELWRPLTFATRPGDPRPAPGLPPIVEGLYVDQSVAQQPRSLAARAEAQPPYFGFLSGVTPEDCVVDGSSPTRKAVDVLHDIGRRVRRLARAGVLFIPPTLPLQTEAAPRCLFELAQREVAAQEDQGLRTISDRWDAWGVSYGDFLYPTDAAAMLRVDIFHVNQSGAIRVTRRIADALMR